MFVQTFSQASLIKKIFHEYNILENITPNKCKIRKICTFKLCILIMYLFNYIKQLPIKTYHTHIYIYIYIYI